MSQAFSISFASVASEVVRRTRRPLDGMKSSPRRAEPELSAEDRMRQFWAGARKSLFSDDGVAPVTGLRAFAMLWVIFFHGVTTSSTVMNSGQLDPPTPWQHIWWPVAFPMSGDVGVDLFLVISGVPPPLASCPALDTLPRLRTSRRFTHTETWALRPYSPPRVRPGYLLGGMLARELEKTGSVAFARFYLRRWFRITPAYASAILVSIWLEPDAKRQCPQIWWTNMFYINNLNVRCAVPWVGCACVSGGVVEWVARDAEAAVWTCVRPPCAWCRCGLWAACGLWVSMRDDSRTTGRYRYTQNHAQRPSGERTLTRLRSPKWRLHAVPQWLLRLLGVPQSGWFLGGAVCMVHTWSIAVEVQMYLFTPPLMVLGHKISLDRGIAPVTPLEPNSRRRIRNDRNAGNASNDGNTINTSHTGHASHAGTPLTPVTPLTPLTPVSAAADTPRALAGARRALRHR